MVILQICSWSARIRICIALHNHSIDVSYIYILLGRSCDAFYWYQCARHWLWHAHLFVDQGASVTKKKGMETIKLVAITLPVSVRPHIFTCVGVLRKSCTAFCFHEWYASDQVNSRGWVGSKSIAIINKNNIVEYLYIHTGKLILDRFKPDPPIFKLIFKNLQLHNTE